jgi:hypothetical protein
MKKLMVCILSSFIGMSAQAIDIQNIHCSGSSRAVSGDLSVDIDLANNFLSYDFWKSDSNKPSQTYSLHGSNQEGFGTSVLSKGSVIVANLPNDQIKVKGLGFFYDRATLKGKTDIEVLIKKIASSYKLISFKVNNTEHSLSVAHKCSIN